MELSNLMESATPLEPAISYSARSSMGSGSPERPEGPPKSVAFELLFPESPQYRARLPLRVQIYPHDLTENIVTTVKNFYGLYPGPTASKGVSFEDDRGNTLIASYENFSHNMVVYVRVIEGSPQPSVPFNASAFVPTATGTQSYSNGDYPLQPVQQLGQHTSRPASRTSRKRSPSPNGGRGRRSTSASTNPVAGKKGRSRSSKTRGPNYDNHSDSMNGYSSGDNAPGSVSSKTKEPIGNTDISVENIVEGGRRKRAKFESSELPLFAPPQMPAATSNPSVSPARRIEHHRPALPFAHPGQNPFTNPRPLQSPQSYSNGYSHIGIFATPTANARRHRGSIGYPNGHGILPTPDPTVGSCMSEEDKDVAIQLMRLGEMSNISHGRTSASTLDDTFSGKADAASSTGATSDSDSDSEDELPPARRQKLETSGINGSVFYATESHFIPCREHAEASGEDADYEDGGEDGLQGAKLNGPKPKSQKPRLPSLKTGSRPKSKIPKASTGVKSKKSNSISAGPMSPTSLPAQSRNPSIVGGMVIPGQEGGDGQPDLSTKPRCQRCRKSKKGCDRQRPCGRCRDAGLSADQCVSEDEGNGRKGRYGRHMGVPVKTHETPGQPTLLPAAPILVPMAPPAATDKNKKRKR
ncbi:putative C6 finger domain protein [Xylariales sp. AK1849]|nr:putative C6 finger domain protein [Xylariales sp. AK1849]